METYQRRIQESLTQDDAEQQTYFPENGPSSVTEPQGYFEDRDPEHTTHKESSWGVTSVGKGARLKSAAAQARMTKRAEAQERAEAKAVAKAEAETKRVERQHQIQLPETWSE